MFYRSVGGMMCTKHNSKENKKADFHPNTLARRHSSARRQGPLLSVLHFNQHGSGAALVIIGYQ
jgi:hypothetical protein